MNQPVKVEAVMRQRYNGQHFGRGDQFDMTETDAADAVALNLVRRVKPAAIDTPAPPKQLPVITRDMPPEGKKEETEEQEQEPTPQSDSESSADETPPKPAVAGRHGGNQQPYQNRNTHTRGSHGNRR